GLPCACVYALPPVACASAVLLTCFVFVFFFQAEDGIRDRNVTGVQTCALPISAPRNRSPLARRRSGAQTGDQLGSCAPFYRGPWARRLPRSGVRSTSPV